jgi:hypothetical protein
MNIFYLGFLIFGKLFLKILPGRSLLLLLVLSFKVQSTRSWPTRFLDNSTNSIKISKSVD